MEALWGRYYVQILQRIQQFQTNKLFAHDHTAREKPNHNMILICLTHQDELMDKTYLHVWEMQVLKEKQNHFIL